MKRVFFLNRFFLPDHSATSQLLGDLTSYLAQRGRDVHVVTSRQRYDDPQADLPAQETIAGVHVHRVATTRFGRSALLGRGIDYLSFYASLWRRAGSLVGRGDILIAMTDPPLTSVLALGAARRRGALLVNWLQDVYPEVAVELRVPLVKGPVSTLLAHARDSSLKGAAANVVVGRLMAERIVARGAERKSVHVIENWSDDENIVPVRPSDNPLRREWSLEGKFVVGYSGNLGRAHEFDTVLAAAERLRNDPHLIFLFIGGGHHVEALAQAARQRNLSSNFKFIGYQDRALLKYSLSVPDLHWISLRPELEGLIVPSKVYGIAAAGRPIVAVTAKAGEIAQAVERHNCGVVIEPGDGEALAEALAQLSADPERVGEMGRRARTMLETQFTRRHALERWKALLNTIG